MARMHGETLASTTVFSMKGKALPATGKVVKCMSYMYEH
jgi:hypothetical protein